MNGLIIGLGSIAKKHIEASRKSNYEVRWYVLRHKKMDANIIEKVENIYDINDIKIDFILISNPTYLHFETIEKVLKFGKPVFIEKPVLKDLENVDFLQKKIDSKHIQTYIGCNLRFHPVIKWLYNTYKEGNEFIKIDEINIYCGSYLPDWRCGRNYKNTYSAQKKMGGGVHLDLIHELDFTYWIFGKPNSIISGRKNSSHLKIDAVDSALYWLEYSNFVVNISLNYYRKDAKRTVEIVSENGTYLLDLINCRIEKDGETIFEQKNYSIETTYIFQLNYFFEKILNNKYPFFNTFADGINVLKMALNKNIWKD